MSKQRRSSVNNQSLVKWQQHLLYSTSLVIPIKITYDYGSRQAQWAVASFLTLSGLDPAAIIAQLAPVHGHRATKLIAVKVWIKKFNDDRRSLAMCVLDARHNARREIWSYCYGRTAISRADCFWVNYVMTSLEKIKFFSIWTSFSKNQFEKLHILICRMKLGL